MIAIRLIYDVYTTQVESQIARDMIALKSSYPRDTFACVCSTEQPNRVLQSFGIPIFTVGEADMVIVYKSTEFWPEHPSEEDNTVVLRDMYCGQVDVTLDGTPRVSYVPPAQGRPTPNRVKYGQAAPVGVGYVDPALLMMWGGPSMDSGTGIV